MRTLIMATSGNWRCVQESPLASRASPPTGWDLYRIDAGAVTQISVHPASKRFTIFYDGSPSRTLIDHCINELVIPRLLTLDVELVLHAGAVATDVGAAAFLGPSRHGKSTLTGSLGLAGYPVLSDDSLILERSGGRWFLERTSGSLRLFPDSVESLFPEACSIPPLADYTTKRIVPYSNGIERAPLASLFLLGAPAENITVTPLRSGDACMAIVANAFALDRDDTQEARRRFASAADVAKDINMFELRYPREYDALPAVHEAIARTLGLSEPKGELP